MTADAIDPDLPNPSEVRVLVVDDSDAERQALHELIEAEGYKVISLGGGREALEYVQDTRVDLIVTELQMRDIDGWDLLDAVKKKHPDIHVVATTGSISEQGEALLKSRKADGYLVKPVKQRPLQILLRALLSPDNLDRLSEVLAVSADATSLELIDEALGDRGIYVRPFNHVRRALANIWNDPPDLIVTDLKVGKEDGFELVRQVRSTKKIPFIPIVVATADPSKQQITQAVQLRVNGVLTKPLGKEILCDRTLKLLRQYGRAT